MGKSALTCAWLLLLLVVLLSIHATVAVDRIFLDNKSFCHDGLHNITTTSKAKKKTEAPETFRVRWKTTSSVKEDIVLEIYRDWAPIGVDRFYQLILDNYYNCAAFFRVVPGFVVQFGISSNPVETAKWNAAIVDDPVGASSNLQGTVSFATAGPETRTTQIFINLKDNAFLDQSGFCPFGKILSGVEAILAINNPTPNSGDGVDQSAYQQKGNEWILQEYPQIDIIESTDLLLPL